MMEMLWTDPQTSPGRGPSKRGVGLQFGPDVTKRFCEKNGLEAVIRSHEVRMEGYEEEHDGRCITGMTRWSKDTIDFTNTSQCSPLQGIVIAQKTKAHTSTLERASSWTSTSSMLYRILTSSQWYESSPQSSPISTDHHT
jgi:hypothetical protein